MKALFIVTVLWSDNEWHSSILDENTLVNDYHRETGITQGPKKKAMYKGDGDSPIYITKIEQTPEHMIPEGTSASLIQFLEKVPSIAAKEHEGPALDLIRRQVTRLKTIVTLNVRPLES